MSVAGEKPKGRKSTRLVDSYRRIRASAHFREIHTMIVKDLPISYIVRRIQTEWREMVDVSPEGLEKQLRRYKDALRVGGKLPHERMAEKPSWVAGLDKGSKGGTTIVVGEGGRGGGTTLAIPEGKGGGGGDAIVGEVIEPPMAPTFDARAEMIKLYKVADKRIGIGLACEKEISQLLPTMAMEISVARDILKTIHIMDGDLGLRHQEPTKVGVAVGVGMTKALEEKLNGLGIGGVLADEKSRSKILAALRGVTPLVQGTSKPTVSEVVSEPKKDAK